MTLQEMFETAVTGVFYQGDRSLNAQLECCYRSPDGKKCAVGFLISDDVYDPNMDECSGGIVGVIDNYEYKLPSYIIDNETFLERLQNIHDLFDYEDWPEKFKEVADEYNLEWTKEIEKAEKSFNEVHGL